jgi:hypothetical protein
MRSTKKKVTVQSLQRRIERLERDIQDLKRTFSIPSETDNRPWWQQIAGDFEDDPVFAEIIRLGRKIRRAEPKGSR